MKKSVLLLATALVAISCGPEGKNKGTLKKTDDVVRYDDPNAPKGTFEAKPTSVETPATVVVDSAKVATSAETTEVKAAN